MGLFDDHFNRLRSYLNERKNRPDLIVFEPEQITADWPAGTRNNLVLSSDMAVELGSPQTASTSFLAWTDQVDTLNHARLTLLGPDIPAETRDLVPFGKAVLVGVEGFDENNSYERFREMELAKYDIRLLGYMMRAVSQYQREWSRISHEAVADNFSLAYLSRALVRVLTALPYVKAVEVLFVTASVDDVLELKTIGDDVAALTGAMNKMGEEMDFDCSSCEYQPVCDSVSELKAMKRALQRNQAS